MTNIKIGDIYWVKFHGIGSEQCGTKPAIIVQNDIGNKFSPTVKVVPLTSKSKTELPTHVNIVSGEYGITKDSIALCEQETICDKSMLGIYIGSLPNFIMEKIAVALTINTPVIAYMDEKALLMLFNNLKRKNNLSVAV